jgi:hypothetical protein
MALAWAETCSSVHVEVIIYNKACVVLDGKLYPTYKLRYLDFFTENVATSTKQISPRIVLSIIMTY